MIIDTARIEEVVGDFVSLKRRGTNLIGLCPFHNEKTPSFNVSLTRGIYKCFGCGKGGNSVNFVMEHEQYSYPEALRYLASKYNIAVEEDEKEPGYDLEQLQRESLLVVTEFARKFYSRQLHETDEGRAIGLSYFHEREFTEGMIEKFQLGYSPDNWRGLTDAALEAGFLIENLEKAGLTIVNENKTFDRFRGRVMFPIHNITGKVIAFGARILKTDPKSPKYLNSPESDIYHKSNILYGIFFAKKSVIAKDECFLVEGYTDVIALHQVGIENVVASSGTSLTVEQIRLIGRYTKNITILYDGDPAGIKASLRGIDLILEEGLNVRVVLFPDGEDPDTFSRKHNSYEVAAFIAKQVQDFVHFKTKLLIELVGNDPIKKAELIRDVVTTISKIVDPLSRSQYQKSCSELIGVEEQLLISESNKIITKNVLSKRKASEVDDVELIEDQYNDNQLKINEYFNVAEYQEADIIRLLLTYGEQDIFFEEAINERETRTVAESVKSFIVHEISQDNITFENPVFAKIFSEFENMVHSNEVYNPHNLINHEQAAIRNIAADMLTVKYPLAMWSERGVAVKEEIQKLKHAVMSAVYSIKIKHIARLMKEKADAIKEAAALNLDTDNLQREWMELDAIKRALSSYLSIVILK